MNSGISGMRTVTVTQTENSSPGVSVGALGPDPAPGGLVAEGLA